MSKHNLINYHQLGANVLIPHESTNYASIAQQVLNRLRRILDKRHTEPTGKHLIMTINEQAKYFPMINMNKYIPLEIESLADCAFLRVNTQHNPYQLSDVKIGRKRTDLADIVLCFKINGQTIPVNIDVKATDDNIKTAGKGPNITSFPKIRSAYLANPNFIYIILDVCYQPAIKTDINGHVTIDVLITNYHLYDFKYMSAKDFDINPALGQGQIQVKDIHHVHTQRRTTWKLLKLLDNKYVKSSKRTPKQWLQDAIKYHWLKNK